MLLMKDPHCKRALRARVFSQSGVFLLMLATLCGLALSQTPQAYASNADNNNPIIHWDQSMIYPGQNKGDPEGPIGETAVVHGSGFTANQALTLVIVAGDSNSDPTLCQPPGSASVAQVGTATTDASGEFNATFAWPADVGHVGKTRKNSICAYSNSNLVSSHDDGPFTVLTDNKPTFKLSTSKITAGHALTITGQNWVPAQPLNVTIASCADCDPGSNNVITATTTSIGQTTGTFSVNVPIPETIAANNYVVNVTSQAGPLDAYHIDGLGVKQLAIAAAPITPTPTAAATPSATAVPTQTVAATPASTSTTTNTNSNGSNKSLIMILLIVFALLLLAIGGIIFFVMFQKKKPDPASSRSTGGISQPDAFSAPHTPVTPFPQNQPMSTPGQFSNAVNNVYPGQPQGQAWQGMPQSNRQGNPGSSNIQPSRPSLAPENLVQGAGRPGSTNARLCVRCGNPLAPNTYVCRVCGTRNAPAPDPNDLLQYP